MAKKADAPKKPMKLRKKLLPEFIWPDAKEYDLCQPKIDGWFCRLIIAGGRALFTARNGAVLQDRAVDPAFPDSIFQGEIIHGTRWAKKQSNLGHFFAFDLESSIAQTYGQRWRQLQAILSAHPLNGVSLMDCREYDGQNFVELQNHFVRTGGFEGMVFRNSRSLDHEILVSKEKQSWDFYVTAFYTGEKGRAILGLAANPGGPELMRCCVPRDEMDSAKIGDCAEILGDYLTAKGAVQGCAFYRWRPDKTVLVRN
jgi:hypothetical protein